MISQISGGPRLRDFGLTSEADGEIIVLYIIEFHCVNLLLGNQYNNSDIRRSKVAFWEWASVFQLDSE
jgi:hypothetical protein